MIIPILYLVAFLILFIILLKVTKILWKAILFTIIAFLLITCLISYLVYKDATNIINKDKVFILVHDQDLLTGGVIKGQFNEMIYFNDSEMESYSECYLNKDNKCILGNRYLLIILETRSLEELNLTITQPGRIIQGEDLVRLLEIKDQEEFITKASELNLTYLQDTSQEILVSKVAITKGILENTLKEDSTKLTKLIKEVRFYPDRLSILILKQMPLKVILSFIIKDTINGG